MRELKKLWGIVREAELPKCLIVEPRALHGSMTVGIFSSLGFLTFWSHTVKEAFLEIPKIGPHIIIANTVFPEGLGALSLITRIRTFAQAPVIALVSYQDPTGALADLIARERIVRFQKPLQKIAIEVFLENVGLMPDPLLLKGLR